MGGVSNLLSDIKNQFISLYDAVCLIADIDNCTKEQALVFIKLKMLDEQIYLLLIDGMHLVQVRLYQDEYYYDDGYDGETIAKTTITQQLQASIAQGKPTNIIEHYGFGAKRFYETADRLGVDIPPDILYNAQSPDCFHDMDNPLTPIVKELQTEIKALKKPIAPTKPIKNLGEVGTLEMQITMAVFHHFWQNHDDNTIPPKKDTIVAWIKDRYQVSENIASAIDSITRPEAYRKGGQKAR